MLRERRTKLKPTLMRKIYIYISKPKKTTKKLSKMIGNPRG